MSLYNSTFATLIFHIRSFTLNKSWDIGNLFAAESGCFAHKCYICLGMVTFGAKLLEWELGQELHPLALSVVCQYNFTQFINKYHDEFVI